RTSGGGPGGRRHDRHARRRRDAGGLPRRARAARRCRPRHADRRAASGGAGAPPDRAHRPRARARVGRDRRDARPRTSGRFGVHIPTAIGGMMSPVPFAAPEDILPLALLAERLGFDSVWGNDHMTTQRYVQREWPEPPNFFEPLITFTYVAART